MNGERNVIEKALAEDAEGHCTSSPFREKRNALLSQEGSAA
jgi:hypothetical protein